MTHRIEYDATTNVASLGEQSLVFHCHYYNCALQRAIEEGMGERARAVLSRSAAAPVRDQLIALSGGDGSKVFGIASQVFAQLGFGSLDLTGVSGRGGQARVDASHYAMGWVAAQGDRDEPVCRFVEGFITGTVSAAIGRPIDSIAVNETTCYACGGADCRFDVEVQ